MWSLCTVSLHSTFADIFYRSSERPPQLCLHTESAGARVQLWVQVKV